MERTSSLDLFRGSDAFSTLAFLDGQEPTSEASNGHTAAQDMQSSQAIPASLPVSSMHLTAPGQRPSSKLLHTSRLASGFSPWLQTTSSAYSPAILHQPPSTSHTFLPFGSSASHHPGGTADSQADSFATLLADDTALGFADDCFRRESDLYLSQDRAAQAEAAYASAPLNKSDADSPLDEQSHALGSASSQPAAVSEPQQPASTHSPTQESVAALTELETLSAVHEPSLSPKLAPVAHSGDASQPLPVLSLPSSLPAATENINRPHRHAYGTAVEIHTPCTEPQALHDQLAGIHDSSEPAEHQAAAPAVSQTEQLPAHSKQSQAPQALQRRSQPVSPPTQPAANGLIPSKANSPRAVLSGLAPIPALPQAQAVSPGHARPDVTALDHHAEGLSGSASLPPTAAQSYSQTAVNASQAHHGISASQECHQADGLQQQQQQQPRQQQTGIGASAQGRPKLAVQDYHLPLPQVIKQAPAAEPEGKIQLDGPAVSTQVQQDAHMPTRHTAAASGGQISAQHDASIGSPVVRHWGHNLVSKVINVFPGRVGQPPIPSIPVAQPPPAASQAAATAPIQAVVLTQHLPSTTDQLAQPLTGQAQSLSGDFTPMCELDSQAMKALTQLPAIPLKPSPENGDAVGHETRSLSGAPGPAQPAQQHCTQQATQGPLRHPARVPEAALLARSSPNSSSNANQQLPASSSQSPAAAPSILQDLRNAAAQDSLPQVPAGTAPLADSETQHAVQQLMHSFRPALPDLTDSQETISMPAQRHSITSQSGDAIPQLARTQAQRLSTATQPVCPPAEAIRQGAACPEDKACSALPQGATASLLPQKEAPPGPTPVLTAAPTPPPVGHTAAPAIGRGIPPVSRSQRLADKRAAAQQLRREALTETVPAASLCPKQNKQPAAGGQRLPDKKASDAQDMDRLPAGTILTADVSLVPSDSPMQKEQRLCDGKAAAAQAPGLHDQALLEASVKQTGLDLAFKVEAANSAVPSVLAECLASNRSKRVPGGDPLEAAPFRRFVDMVRSNSPEFEAQGRVLRLKQYISADVRPAAINAILEALAVNTLVEVLYIQNFEQGMFDEQLLRLTEVLKKGRIWALNAGENFEISLQAWETFTKELQHTAVACLYVSEHHLARTDLKRRMQDAIRDNRRQAPRRDAEVIKCVGNMWWNPKLPADARPVNSRAVGGESALASLARDMAASQAGSRQSGSGSHGRKRKVQPQDTAVSSQGEGSGQESGKPLRKHPKRLRSLSLATDSPLVKETGSSDSQTELSLGEKRSLRIKRREQRQEEGATPDSARASPSLQIAAAAVFSPAPSSTMTGQKAPGQKAPGQQRQHPTALGARSRLAGQSGPFSEDSEGADDQAGLDPHDLDHQHHVALQSPGTALIEKSVVSAKGQKRKRQQQQQQQSSPAATVARSVRLANSTDGSEQPEPDALTEQSRSSEAATPLGPTKRRSQFQTKAKPKAAAAAQQAQRAQQAEQELESERPGSVRRTGRQRKLTAAAAAAVDEFPSLYRSSTANLLSSSKKSKSIRNHSNSSAVEDVEQQDSEFAASNPRRGRPKQAHASSSNGLNQVQMSQLVRSGVLPAGRHEFVLAGGEACEVEVLSDGDILYQGELYDSLANFARAALEEIGSTKLGNAWRDLSWRGHRLESLRQAAYTQSLSSKRAQKK